MWREAPARLSRALCEGADTGLPTLLLSLNPRQRFIERAGVSLKATPASNLYQGLNLSVRLKI